MKVLIYFFCIILNSALYAYSEDINLDDFTSNEDFPAAMDNSYTEKINPGNKTAISFTGFYKLTAVMNTAHKKPENGATDWRGFSMLKSELFTEVNIPVKYFGILKSGNWKLKVSGSGFYDPVFSVNSGEAYSDDVLDSYESGWDTEKIFLSGSLSENIDLKTGRQIVVWGQSDLLRITDIINPIDLRTPGLIELEDLRIPLCLTKIDYYFKEWNLSAIMIHEHRFNKLPVFGDDFFTGNTPYPDEEKISNSFKNSEYALSLKRQLEGWDISFYYAEYYEKTPHLHFVSAVYPGFFDMKYSRKSMAGGDMAVSLNNFLFKTEAAYFQGNRFPDFLDEKSHLILMENKKFDSFSIMCGLEYSGFNETNIILEIMNDQIAGFDSLLSENGIKKNQREYALRISKKFMNERLEIMSIAMLYGEKGNGGKIYKLSADYELNDNVIIACGIVIYNSGDYIGFGDISENDRIYSSLKYSF